VDNPPNRYPCRLSPPLQHLLISSLPLCFLASAIAALTICRTVFRGTFDQLPLCLDALVSRRHKSRPLRTHCSLLVLHSSRQPARYATALDDKTILPLFSRRESPQQWPYLLIITLSHDDQVEPAPGPCFLGLSPTSYTFSAPVVSPSSSPCSSSYSLKTIQAIARRLANRSRKSPATNGGSSA